MQTLTFHGKYRLLVKCKAAAIVSLKAIKSLRSFHFITFLMSDVFLRFVIAYVRIVLFLAPAILCLYEKFSESVIYVFSLYGM